MLQLLIINQVKVGKTLKCALRFTQLDILLDLSSSDVGLKSYAGEWKCFNFSLTLGTLLIFTFT